ncbi:MAG: family 10 glycosylhydrolase, partial [Hominimerdicola sp.]
MKKIIILFLCCILLTSCIHENNDTISPERMKKMPYSSVIPIVNKTENTEKNMFEPLNYEIQKAVWISYIDLAPNLTEKTESEFRYNFKKMCKNVSELGCNTIYLHLRPFGDAIYNSEIYPASRYITGVAEKSADFDPLEIMLEIAHYYGLSVHGWINPLRCETKETIMNYSGNYLIKDWLDEGDGKICEVEGDEHLWLNPAFEEVRHLIAEGAKEIAE